MFVTNICLWYYSKNIINCVPTLLPLYSCLRMKMIGLTNFRFQAPNLIWSIYNSWTRVYLANFMTTTIKISALKHLPFIYSVFYRLLGKKWITFISLVGSNSCHLVANRITRVHSSGKPVFIWRWLFFCLIDKVNNASSARNHERSILYLHIEACLVK